jgi:hypothetical protein
VRVLFSFQIYHDTVDMSLHLRKFNPATIGDDKVCIFVGRRSTGKSFLMTDILYYKRHLPCGIVMSGTEDGNHHFKKFIPDLFIYGDYDKTAIERVLARQHTLVSQGKPNSSAFIILDDCMYDKKFLKDVCIRKLFMNGRHWKVFFMLTMQYCMDLSPDLRANTDYVFILRETVLQNREKLYKNFFGIFPSFQMFDQVMTACTEDYHCLVLDNTSKSNKIEDCVFWYKAAPMKQFRIGSPSLWAFHQKYYNPRHDLEPQRPEEDPKKKKNALTIVKKGMR